LADGKVALLLRKTGTLMGLDIGSSSIKLIELMRTPFGYELRSIAVISLPQGAVESTVVKDSAVVLQALTDAIEVAQPSTRKVAISVSGPAVSIKRVSVPRMPHDDLPAYINKRAGKYLDCDINKVFFDYQILGNVADNPTQLDIILASCKREVVEPYQSLLGKAGLQAVCLDYSAFCLENAAELIQGRATREYPDPMEDVHGKRWMRRTALWFEKKRIPMRWSEHADALVNIGVHTSDINILQNGHMSYVADCACGVEKLTQEIQHFHDMNYQDAEQMERIRSPEINSQALEDYYETLAAGLQQAFEAYAVKHAAHPIQKILVSGGGALIPGLEHQLEQRLGIKTMAANPFSTIRAKASRFNAGYLRAIGPTMMVSVGLALRGFDE